MSTIQISPDKLAAFEALTLHEGGHNTFDQGHCAMEVVAWLADEGHTDAPACASPVLRRYTIRLNDRWDDEKRQTLKPYLLRMIGTGGDGKDAIREQIAARYVVSLLVPWLRLAGLDAEADRLAAASTVAEVREACWVARRKAIDEKLKPAVRAELAKRGKPAADADADAVAVADAAAAAVADADAVADAVADADAAAAAVAVADAAADAAAAAVAVADAVAADPWGAGYSAAYRAARDYYRTHPLPISEEVAALAQDQQDAALALLDKLIEANEEDVR